MVNKRKHIIISGTGRSGTTFLVQLFTALGLDTGFETVDSDFYKHCNAGMEKDIRIEDSPYIIKTPWLCDYIEEVLSSKNIKIELAIIPIRDLFSAAESRRFVSDNYEDKTVKKTDIPGGLWHADIPELQEEILAKKLYNLIYFLTIYNVPIVFLYFPKFVKDPTYLYNKLNTFLNLPKKDIFKKIFYGISKPELIHDFLI